MNKHPKHHPIAEYVSCKLCDQPTDMTSTKLCDRCYELDKRVRLDPEITRKILNEIDAGR